MTSDRVADKVMFSQACVILFTSWGGGLYRRVWYRGFGIEGCVVGGMGFAWGILLTILECILVLYISAHFTEVKE